MMIELEILLYGLIGLGVLFGVEGIFHLMGGNDRGQLAINRRLKLLAQGRTSQSVVDILRRERDLAGTQGFTGSLMRPLKTLLLQSGRHISFGAYCLGLGLACAIITVAMTVVAGTFMPWFVILAVLVAFVSSIGVLRFLRSRNVHRFNYQLPGAIDLIVRSLLAGHPIQTSINLVAKEMPDPLGSQFGLVVDEMAFGLDLKDALRNVEQRIPSPDLGMMVVAVDIQSSVGGNLAEILTSLGNVIRERFQLRRKVKALSAEGRFSAIALGLVPPSLFFAVNLLNPDYYSGAWSHPLFWPIMGFFFGLMLVGYIVMYKLVNFKV